ncbi:MAG: arsenate reductase ArsC [Methanomassiliicoccales archaeon]|nr:MAG: arsenate reductase ArsC [Methanomassiliicoccales archaeon]
MAKSKQTILFICQGNNARSLMAEGLVNHLFKDRYEAFSAGTQPSKVDPLAVKVMKEIGIDITKARSKNVDTYYGKPFDYVVTLCDEAEEECSFFIQGKDYIHESFPDPTKLEGSEEKVISDYRKVRDGIRAFVKETFGGR